MDADVTSKLYVRQLAGPAPPPPQPDRPSAALLALSGPLLGEVFSLCEPVILGRGDDADVRIPAEGVSRRHARLLPRRGGWLLEDLGSRNGTWVNRRLIDRVSLQVGDQIRLGATTVLKFCRPDPLERDFRRQLHDSALCDALTGMFNKRYFLERLRQELAYAARHRCPLSLLMLDIDHFKAVNDRHGHITGDRALCAIGEAVRATMRGEDVLCRYGGEEFALLCRGVTLLGAQIFAERVRRTVAEIVLFAATADERVPLTVSIGVTQLPERLLREEAVRPGQGAERLIALADRALYAAKEAGRNCVRLAHLR